MNGPTPSLSYTQTPHERTSYSKIAGRLFQKKEEFLSAQGMVLSNEVRRGLLAASVNSVGAGKWQLAVSSEVELRMMGWVFK